MSEDEISQKVREAEFNAEEDRRFREMTEAKNNAESLIYQTEKLMKENEALIGDLKDGIIRKISDLKAAIQSEDLKAIKETSEALQSALHEVSTRMYGQQQGPGGSQGAPPGGMGDVPPGGANSYQGKTQDEIEEEKFRRASGQDDGVVDAEFD